MNRKIRKPKNIRQLKQRRYYTCKDGNTYYIDEVKLQPIRFGVFCEKCAIELERITTMKSIFLLTDSYKCPVCNCRIDLDCDNEKIVWKSI